MTASDSLGPQWRIEDHPDPYYPKSTGRVKLAYPADQKGGWPAGRVRYDPEHESFDDNRTKVVDIKHVGVEPEHQRKGVARALYQSIRADHPDTPILHHVDDQTRAGNSLARTLSKEDPKGHRWLHFSDGANGETKRTLKATPPRRRPTKDSF